MSSAPPPLHPSSAYTLRGPRASVTLLAPGAATSQKTTARFAPSENLAPRAPSLVAEHLDTYSLFPVLFTAGDQFANSGPFQAPQPLVSSLALAAPLEGQVGRAHLGGPQWLRIPLLDSSHNAVPSTTATATGVSFGVGLFGQGSLAATTGSGYAALGGGASQTRGNVLHAESATVIAWRNNLGVGLGYNVVNEATGGLFTFSGLMAFSGERDVVDLGEPPPAEWPTLRAAFGIEDADLRHLEIRHRRSRVRNLRLGGGTFKAAVMARLDVQSDWDVTYRTYVSAPMARRLLFGEDDGRSFPLRRVCRAWGLAEEAIEMPRPGHPMTLTAGEEVQFLKTKTWVAGLLVGDVAAWATSQAWFRGDVNVLIKQTGPRAVEIVLTPVRIRARNLYALSPLGVFAGIKKSRAHAVRQKLTFDLTVLEAREALAATLAGNPPHPSATLVEETARKQRYGEASSGAAPAPLSDLPLGVTRPFLHLISGTLAGATVGAKFLFVPRGLLPTRVETGLGITWQKLSEQQVFRDATRTWYSEVSARVKTVERGLQGQNALRASATVLSRRAQPDDPQRVESLTLAVDASATHASRRAFFSRTLGSLEMPGAQRPSRYDPPGLKQGRQLSWTQSASAPQVARLGGLLEESGPVEERRGFVSKVAAARQAGVSPDALHKLLEKLAAAPQAHEQMALIRAFVLRKGPRGASALMRLLGDHAPVALRAGSDAACLALYQANEVVFQFADVCSPISSPQAILGQLRQIAAAVKNLDRARADLILEQQAGAQHAGGLLAALALARQACIDTSLVPEPLWRVTREQLNRTWRASDRPLGLAAGFGEEAIACGRRLIAEDARLVSTRDDAASAASASELQTLVERLTRLSEVVARLDEALVWCEAPEAPAGLLVSPESFLHLRRALRQTRERLVGTGPFPQGPWEQMASLGRLLPQERRDFRRLLPRWPRNNLERHLRRALNAD